MKSVQTDPLNVENDVLLAGTISVVSAFLQASPSTTENIDEMIREVHRVMLDVAKGSETVSANIQGGDFERIFKTASEQLGVVEPPPVVAPVAAPENPEVGAEAAAGAPPQLALALVDPVSAPAPRRARSTKAKPAKKNTDKEAAPKRGRKAAKEAEQATEAAQASVAEVAADAAPELFQEAPQPVQEAPRTAARVKGPKGKDRVSSSVRMNAIICLEDNVRVTDLAAHLFEKFDMSPETYREKWNLPASYPMHPPAHTLKRGDQFEIDPVTQNVIPLRG